MSNIDREHTQYHLRSLDQQILDALLRIEELLSPKATVEATAEDVLATRPGGVTPVKKKATR